MFNLKSLSASFQKSTLKVVASNRFIDVMSSEINNARQQTRDNSNEQDLDYDFFMANGISFLKNFLDNMQSNNQFLAKDSFDLSVDSFAEALKIKQSRAEPYFYLAWLFNIAEENELSVKYLKVARNLNPELNGLNELSEQITQSISNNNNSQKSVSETVPSNILKKPVINHIRTLKRG